MRTVLLSGGSRGIGAATVRAFAAAGWRVAFLYRQSEAPALALSQATGAVALRCDVRDPASVAEACAQATRALGHVDALVNNAGVAQQKLLTDVTDADWRDMLDTHLSGAFYLSRAVLGGMIRRGEGRIKRLEQLLKPLKPAGIPQQRVLLGKRTNIPSVYWNIPRVELHQRRVDQITAIEQRQG